MLAFAAAFPPPGFYGVSETQTFNEESRSGNDYLAEVWGPHGRLWESAEEEACLPSLPHTDSQAGRHTQTHGDTGVKTHTHTHI